MAINPQYKVNKMAKDLGMKSKELSDLLAAQGVEVKTQRTLEPMEFDLLFETLTRNHQISNIEDYLDGVTKIPSKVPSKEPEQAKEASAPTNEPIAPKAEPTPSVAQKKEPEKAVGKLDTAAATKASVAKTAPMENKPAPAVGKIAPSATPKAAPTAAKSAAPSSTAPSPRGERPAQGATAPYHQNNNAPRTDRARDGAPYGQAGYGQRAGQNNFNSRASQGAPDTGRNNRFSAGSNAPYGG